MKRNTFIKSVLFASLSIPLIVNSQCTVLASYDSEQCKGITTQNVQCKNTVKNTSGLCYLHDPNYVKKTETTSVVCSDTTQAGNPCKVKTKDASGICHHHRD